MITTKELPQHGVIRTRKVFALLPVYFYHGSNDKPLRTTVWLDYYLIDYKYFSGSGAWHQWTKRLLDQQITESI